MSAVIFPTLNKMIKEKNKYQIKYKDYENPADYFSLFHITL